MLPFALREAFGLAAAGASLSLSSPVHAADPSDASQTEAASPEPQARIAWGLRPNAGAGAGGEGFTGRVGLDGEYWFNDNIGIGAQLAYQASTTISLWPSDAGLSGSEHRYSIAPAVTLRGNDRVKFPIVSLALGYSWGQKNDQSHCNSADVGCMPSIGSNDVASVYASLAAAWMFHLGRVRPGSEAFALGPVARLDWWTYHEYWNAGFGFDAWSGSFTVGLAMGFESARAAAR